MRTPETHMPDYLELATDIVGFKRTKGILKSGTKLPMVYETIFKIAELV